MMNSTPSPRSLTASAFPNATFGTAWFARMADTQVG